MEQKTLDELKSALLAEQKRIQEELAVFATKDPVLKGDWDTKMPQFGEHTSEQDENEDEVEEYEDLLPVEHTLELRLQDINLALKKIEQGNYGICEKCGNPIELDRLKANPEAKTCVKDAE